MKTKIFLFASAFLGVFITSCSDDDDSTAVSQEEVITTMTITLTDGDGGEVSLKVLDEDGDDGPSDPVPTVSGSLKASTTYTGSIELLNETENPAEDVTEEIKEEAAEHQFFYITDDLGITTAYTDQECTYNETIDCADNVESNPVGLTFTLTTTEMTGDAMITFTLRHKPNKGADGVSEGDITNAGGDTDIDYEFTVSVE